MVTGNTYNIHTHTHTPHIERQTNKVANAINDWFTTIVKNNGWFAICILLWKKNGWRIIEFESCIKYQNGLQECGRQEFMILVSINSEYRI